MKKRIIAIVVFAFLASFVHTQTKSEPNQRSVYYYTIDGFEVKDEWKVKYSKYRSRKWNVLDEKPGDNSREDDKEWYDWFTADGKKFSKKEILPTFVYKNQDKLAQENTIFGFKARWDFKGQNWISIEPSNLSQAPEKRVKYFEQIGKKESPYATNNLGRYTDEIMSNDDLSDQDYTNYDGGNYILLPGDTQRLILFVWGSGYKYDLEYHIEDHNNNLYILNAGSINFKGWQRVTADVPQHIRQAASYLPRYKPLKLKRIRLVLDQYERLSGTYVFFDYLHGRTDTNLGSYDGEGLENSQRVWKQNKTQSEGK